MKKRILAAMLAAVMLVGTVPAMAAEGGTMSSAVELTADAGRFDVELPTVLPVHVDAEGNVTVGDDAAIVNNSAGPVRIASMTVEPAEGWSLVPMDTDFSAKPVDTREFGISLFGSEVGTDGCVDVSGVGNIAGRGYIARSSDERLPMEYAVKCGVFSSSGDVAIAKVVSVIENDNEHDTVIAPVDAILDWEYSLNDNLVILTKYIGVEDAVRVYSKYKIDGNVYDTEIGPSKEIPPAVLGAGLPATWEGPFVGSSHRNSFISITVDDGVLFPSDSQKMFYGLTNLREFVCDSPNLGNVASMRSMFLGCSNVSELYLDKWDMTHVSDIRSMFMNCESLTVCDVGAWVLTNCTMVAGIFCGCSSLVAIDVANWQFSKELTSLQSMFQDCTSLKDVNLSNWDVSGVTYANSLFSSCSSIEAIDISGWSTNGAITAYGMFSNCSNLVTIYGGKGIDNKFVSAKNSPMFDGCSKLVGGNGTKWTYYYSSGNFIDATWARVDKTGVQGFFTAKP